MVHCKAIIYGRSGKGKMEFLDEAFRMACKFPAAGDRRAAHHDALQFIEHDRRNCSISGPAIMPAPSPA